MANADPTKEAPAQERLHTFLKAAAGEGLVLDGIDAIDLYLQVFPERYAKDTTAQPTQGEAPSERERFEREMQRAKPLYPLKKSKPALGEPEYLSAGTQHAWVGWQLCATLASQPQAFGDLTGVRPCCGDFANCHRACTPRGRWQASQTQAVDAEDAAWLKATKEKS